MSPLPVREMVRQAGRFLAACLLAFGIAAALGLHERYWALITAIVVTQPMLSDTLAAGRDRIAGTLVGAVVGFVVLELVHLGLPLPVLFWVALVPLALLVAVRPTLRLSMVTLCVVTLVPAAAAPFARPRDRDPDRHGRRHRGGRGAPAQRAHTGGAVGPAGPGVEPPPPCQRCARAIDTLAFARRVDLATVPRRFGG